jgi:hypothetical protein
MPESLPILRRLAARTSVGLLVALALTSTGCRLTKVQSGLTPLTDDLAEQLRSQVSGVLNRTDETDQAETLAGEESAAENIGTRNGGDDQPTSNTNSVIQGAGFSRGPLDTVDTPPLPPPGRLTLPNLGNVPDMARRLMAPLPPLPPLPQLPPLWNVAGAPEQSPESQTDSALSQLIDSAHDHVNELGPGTTPEQNQQYIRNQVYLRLLSLIGERPEDALEPIPGIDNSEKEFLQKLLWAQVNYFDLTGTPEPDKRATATIEQLDAAIRSLQSRAQLKLKHLALCRQIQTFGNYEPFEKNTFSPGQSALLYVEIQNFTSRPTGDGRLETLLKSMITIREAPPNGQAGPAGRIVHEIPVGVTPDICRTTRRDYFHNYEFKFPRTLPLGRYVLRLTVTDLHGNKKASESLRFVLR